MGYYSNLDIDTRTCGQADEDARLDKRDGLTSHYTLIATPGMELFAGCPLCEADHALAACPRWHADTGAPLIARLRADREALMEGIGLDPSPECADEYWPGRLRGEGYGLRMCVTAQDAMISELRTELATAHEVMGALLTNPNHDDAINAARTWLRKDATR